MLQGSAEAFCRGRARSYFEQNKTLWLPWPVNHLCAMAPVGGEPAKQSGRTTPWLWSQGDKHTEFLADNIQPGFYATGLAKKRCVSCYTGIVVEKSTSSAADTADPFEHRCKSDLFIWRTPEPRTLPTKHGITASWISRDWARERCMLKNAQLRTTAPSGRYSAPGN